MDGNTHKIIGVCSGLCAALITNQTALPAIALIGSSFAGSLIPDIDEPHSLVGRHVPGFSHALKVIFEHRGAIHTPFTMILTTALIYFILKPWCPVEYISAITIGWVVGYLSHLILDTITPQGIMWYFPFSKWYTSFQSSRFVTGTGVFATILICVYIMLSRYFPEVLTSLLTGNWDNLVSLIH